MGRCQWIVTCRKSDQAAFEELGFIDDGAQLIEPTIRKAVEERADLVTLINAEAYEPDWPCLPFFGQHGEDRDGEYGPHLFASDNGEIAYCGQLVGSHHPAADLDLATLRPNLDDAKEYRGILNRVLVQLGLPPVLPGREPGPSLAKRIITAIDTGVLRQPEWESLDLESKRRSQQQSIYDHAVRERDLANDKPIQIVVECSGGCVQAVHLGGLPFEYQVLDWDNGDDGERIDLDVAGRALLPSETLERLDEHNAEIDKIDAEMAAKEAADNGRQRRDDEHDFDPARDHGDQ